ncbi:hypothetical protein DTL21_06095 [Bremerella cremea]|uniref:Uncharacterized protein n=1 Tax=Blastopirellula marina TaxID=124 RepID=A0A2S8FZ94_9BACT|nr:MULTISPECIES: hypothetical protein [Pirellulaceae]PQO37512.1 hypothetical protein C5Y83_06095 [Blastopirellula marina]RCS49899.1 hypothetical protein DTL21_06095 [Bremerella cremea]
MSDEATQNEEASAKPRPIATLQELFLLQLGCVIVFLTYRYLGFWQIGLLWFAGGFAAMLDVMTKIEKLSDETCPPRLRSWLLRFASLLIGANFGGFLGLFVAIGLILIGPGINATVLTHIVLLSCLLFGVTAGSILYVGRKVRAAAAVLSLVFAGMFGG